MLTAVPKVTAEVETAVAAAPPTAPAFVEATQIGTLESVVEKLIVTVVSTPADTVISPTRSLPETDAQFVPHVVAVPVKTGSVIVTLPGTTWLPAPSSVMSESPRVVPPCQTARCVLLPDPLTEPVAPVAPVAPVGPIGPLGPVGPVAPVAPVGPGAPVWPVAPVAPVAPVGPVGPVGPPDGPVAPVAPVGPTTPVSPVGPVAPAEPVGPVGPIDPVGPAAPVAPVAPAGP